MNDTLEKLQQRLAELQDQIEAEIAERRAQWRYRMENRRIVFEEGVREAHRAARVKLWAFLRQTRPLVVLTAPFIYALILPLVLLDLFVTAYQAICFPVYGIAKVRRSDHIAIDRQHLAYLNGLQKLNCIYCGYANGLISYVRDIAGRTEQYWCPIKHARNLHGMHGNYPAFVDYGDAEGFTKRLTPLRHALREPPKPRRTGKPPPPPHDGG
ncbi:hypothetical protein [Phaeovulum sp. NW3]|uniref:hypothetical protein n=1 Tax=Phaeovulum sp. NW3 TaxID=2934933 RepID=UPI0020221EEB|nr:hypothetical protein [Phaeovulum sp. NW3]MCL7465587.1 hypothetical protein [Phaeovulum sp. NW3]